MAEWLRNKRSNMKKLFDKLDYVYDNHFYKVKLFQFSLVILFAIIGLNIVR
jgi:hypothetical protein